MSVILAVFSALMYGCGDFAGGAASRKNSPFTVVLFSQIFGTAAALIAAPLLGARSLVPADFLFGALAGLFGSFGLLVLYQGIAKTPVAVVSPVSAVVGALVPMAFGLMIGENPSAVVWIGSGLCIPAIVLLSYEKSGTLDSIGVRKGIVYGVLAGLGFGGFFIAISRSAPGAGLWPLIAARCTSMTAVFLVSLFKKNPLKPVSGSIGLVILAGLFDMGANITFMLAAQRDILILVSVLTSLYPAPTVLLARIFFGQRMGGQRVAGLLFALAGIACISVG